MVLFSPLRTDSASAIPSAFLRGIRILLLDDLRERHSDVLACPQEFLRTGEDIQISTQTPSWAPLPLFFASLSGTREDFPAAVAGGHLQRVHLQCTSMVFTVALEIFPRLEVGVGQSRPGSSNVRPSLNFLHTLKCSAFAFACCLLLRRGADVVPLSPSPRPKPAVYLVHASSICTRSAADLGRSVDGPNPCWKFGPSKEVDGEFPANLGSEPHRITSSSILDFGILANRLVAGP